MRQLPSELIGLSAILDRRAFPWVAGSLGAGLVLHATCLFAIPKTRESLLRTTASLMEDRRTVTRLWTKHGEQQFSGTEVATAD